MHDIIHGTPDGYQNHHCRCSRCVKAIRDYNRARRVPCKGGCGRLVYPQKRRTGFCLSCVRIKPLVHGTEVGYTKGCRCPECTKASAAARRDRRRRARDRMRIPTLD